MFKVRKLLLELLSWGTARAKLINLSTILIALRVIPPEKIGSLCIFKNFIFPFIFKSCPTKGIFIGCNCPACGLTRATSQILHGNIKEALTLNRLIVIVFPIIVFILGYNLYKLIKNKHSPQS